MKDVKYRNGIPMWQNDDDDWEATGTEEMNDLQAGCKHKTSVLDARDNLNEVIDLLAICHEALINSQRFDIKQLVGNFLHFHITPILKNIEKELSKI